MFMCVCIYCIYIYIFPCWLDNSPGFRHIQMCHGAMVRSSTWIMAVLGGWSSWHPIYITPWHHGFDHRNICVDHRYFHHHTFYFIYNIYNHFIYFHQGTCHHQLFLIISYNFLYRWWLRGFHALSVLLYIVLPVLGICGGMMFHFAVDVLIRFAWNKVPKIFNVYC